MIIFHYVEMPGQVKINKKDCKFPKNKMFVLQSTSMNASVWRKSRRASSRMRLEWWWRSVKFQTEKVT